MPSRYSVPSASTIVEPSLRVTTICLVSSALCWTIGCRTLPRSCCTTAARTAGSGEFNSDMAASLKGEWKTADANAVAVILPGCGRLPQCNRAGVERRSAGAQSGAIKTVRMMRLTGRRAVGEVDSGYAWLRLLAGVLTSTIGGVGMCSIAVVLPTLQADFGYGVRPGFLRKGDRDDQQTVQFGRRDPSLAILGAVTARAMLHHADS